MLMPDITKVGFGAAATSAPGCNSHCISIPAGQAGGVVVAIYA